MKYQIRITETLQRIVSVSASSKGEALDIVWKRYRECDIVLTGDDFMGPAEFELWEPNS